MTARVTPKTWAHEDSVTAAILNEQLRGNMNAVWPYITKGAIAVATGADELAELPVGPDYSVLTADDTQASGVKWAIPAIAKVAEVSLAAPATTIVFTDIPAVFRHLKLVWSGRSSSDSTEFYGSGVHILFNQDETAGAYRHWTFYVADNDGWGPAGQQDSAAYLAAGVAPGGLDPANISGGCELLIKNYAATNKYKSYHGWMSSHYWYAEWQWNWRGNGYWCNTAAINRIDVRITDGFSFLAGSIFSLYGMG